MSNMFLMKNFNSYKKRELIIYFLLIVFLPSCIEIYKRYFEANYVGQAIECFTFMDNVLKKEKYYLEERDPGKDVYKDLIIGGRYTRYDDKIEKNINVLIMLRSDKENGKQIKVSFNVYVPSLEKKKRWVVDEEFEKLFEKIKSNFAQDKIQFTKIK